MPASNKCLLCFRTYRVNLESLETKVKRLESQLESTKKDRDKSVKVKMVFRKSQLCNTWAKAKTILMEENNCFYDVYNYLQLCVCVCVCVLRIHFLAVLIPSIVTITGLSFPKSTATLTKATSLVSHGDFRFCSTSSQLWPELHVLIRRSPRLFTVLKQKLSSMN